MAKGHNRRKRQKRADEANWGNIHKAQFGKASPHLKLPDPPSKVELTVDRVPSSLQKIMKLKVPAIHFCRFNLPKQPSLVACLRFTF